MADNVQGVQRLTTRISGHDQTKINILQMFHAVINRTNVDYAALQWWDFINNVKQNKEAIQYPRFNKLIIVDLMKKFLEISQRIKEDYHSITDDIPLGKKMKQSAGESSSPTIRQQKVVERDLDNDDSKDRLEPESHKDNPEHFNDDNEKDEEKVEEEEGMRWKYQILFQEFNAQAPKIIEELFKNYVQRNVIQVHITTSTSTKTTSLADLQQQLYFMMKRSLQDQVNDPALWERMMLLLRGEKIVKRHKASKRSKSAMGSLSKHSTKDSTTYVSKQQQQQQQWEWGAWVEEIVIDEDEAILKDETPEIITKLQNVNKRVPTIYDYERMRATLNDAITTDQPYGLYFMEQILLMRENDKPDSFSEADFKYLNKNDIKDFPSVHTACLQAV
nr:hypothetical protein [Tanacetum cinerariifolium]